MTTKKPTNKKAPTKPKAKKPAVKKVAVKSTETPTSKPSEPAEAVRVRIATHETGHTHAPIATGNTVTPAPKKKSLWKRIFGF